MKKQIAMLAFAAIAAAAPATADETGLASIHDIKSESGRRLCMTDHFHDGAGSGATRKEAETIARTSWASFTAFEYGMSWGSYDLAAAKSMNCSQGVGSWSCVTSARPCKRQTGPGRQSAKSASR
jgi:hypothetical protein